MHIDVNRSIGGRFGWIGCRLGDLFIGWELSGVKKKKNRNISEKKHSDLTEGAGRGARVI